MFLIFIDANNQVKIHLEPSPPFLSLSFSLSLFLSSSVNIVSLVRMKSSDAILLFF